MKNKIINITICVILFIIPLLTLPKGLAEMTYNIPKYVALLICGVILLVLIILKRKELKFDRIDKTLLIFYILILISMLFSFNIKRQLLEKPIDLKESLHLQFILWFIIVPNISFNIIKS